MKYFKKIYKLFLILISLNYNWYRALIFFKVAPSTEHISLLKSLKRVDQVIDIGANRGQFGLAALSLFPHAKYICFEPIKAAYKVLKEVLIFNKDISFHNFAVGNSHNDIEINISKSEDSSSLLEITDLQNEIFPGTKKKSTQKVKLAKLTDFVSCNELNTYSLMKIDVQGFELEVLKSAQEILNKIQYIYVECSFKELYKNQAMFDDVYNLLIDNNFKLSGVYNLTNDKKGVSIQADFFFINENK